MEITVDTAIKKGKWLLVWSPTLIFFGALGLFSWLFLSLIAGDLIWVNMVCTLATLLLPMFLSFLYYYLMLPRWRIWAFTNVRNVHELKQRAILGQVLPKDGSFLWRFEIKNAKQRQQILELEQRFLTQDVFAEDYDLPFETSYSHSKIANFISLLFAVGSAIGGIIFMLQEDYLLGILLLINALMFGRIAYKRMSINGPVLTISNDGITTHKHGFHAWGDISNEQVSIVSAGETSNYGVSYFANGEEINVSLTDLSGLSAQKLDHVLRTYRGRYEQSTT